MQKIKHLSFIFSLTLVFASPVWSVDFNCSGGAWYYTGIFENNFADPGPPRCPGCTTCFYIIGQTNTACEVIAEDTKWVYGGICVPSSAGDQGCLSPCSPGGCASGFVHLWKSRYKYEWRCPCTGSETKSCYDGPAGTEGIGICRAGTQTCSNGWFGSCQGQVLPQTEICGDGIDNDCDGQVDEGCAVCIEGETRPCAYS